MQSTEHVQTVVFIRHGVAQHNIPNANLRDPNLTDPPLITQGKVAALQAGERIQFWWHTTQAGECIELVVASPLTRCIQTAVVAFLPGSDYDRSPTTICCVESVREAFGEHYPDRRRPKSLLQKHWPMVEFDSHMAEQDELWTARGRETWSHLQKRVEKFVKWLVARSEGNIVVVSHGVWMETFFRMYCPALLGEGERVHNCDAFSCRAVSREGRLLRIENACQI